ncbi:MAG: hypothetical protein KDK30_05495 [Leptospiraceae bacterium]|nr:hypothetical protein [Leptospiraceae bacterium]
MEPESQQSSFNTQSNVYSPGTAATTTTAPTGPITPGKINLGSVFGNAWQGYQSNMGGAIGWTLLAGLIYIPIVFLEQIIVGLFVSTHYRLGFTALGISIARGKPDFNFQFKLFSRYFGIWGVAILHGLMLIALAVPIAVFPILAENQVIEQELGQMLTLATAIVFGTLLIYFVYLFYPAYFHVGLQNRGVMESLGACWKSYKVEALKLFLIMLISVLIFFLSFTLFIIPSIFLGPYALALQGESMRQLIGLDETDSGVGTSAVN